MPGSGTLQFTKNRISTHRPLLQERMPHATLYDDFNGTLATGAWTATHTVGGGAGSAAFAYSLSAGKPSAAHGGWLRGTVADSATGFEEIAGVAVQWLPASVDSGALIFETRIVHVSSVAATNVSMGFSDLVTQGVPGAMDISGTTVFVTTAANGACWVYDTRGTTDIYYGLSVDDGTDSAANTTLAAQGFVPVINKSYILRVELDASGNAWFYYGTADDDKASVGAGVQLAAAAVLKDTLLTPYIGLGNCATTANKSLDVDYIFVAAPRV